MKDTTFSRVIGMMRENTTSCAQEKLLTTQDKEIPLTTEPATEDVKGDGIPIRRSPGSKTEAMQNRRPSKRMNRKHGHKKGASQDWH